MIIIYLLILSYLESIITWLLDKLLLYSLANIQYFASFEYLNEF
jgi:hypothetical protein